jgi:hypothetical protein
MRLHLSSQETEPILLSRVGEKKMRTLTDIQLSELPKLAYISYDGDLWSHNELMKQFILGKGYTYRNIHTASTLSMEELPSPDT